MRRTIAAALVLAFGLVGCADSEDIANDDTEDVSQEQTTPSEEETTPGGEGTTPDEEGTTPADEPAGGAAALRRLGDGLWTGMPVDGPPAEAQPLKPPASFGSSRSGLASSSTLTSLNVTTLTFLTKRAGRYMSQTQASLMVTSK